MLICSLHNYGFLVICGAVDIKLYSLMLDKPTITLSFTIPGVTDKLDIRRFVT